MPTDIRDKAHLDHQDIVNLNFVKNPGVYYFRRHFRAGLRSHLMELLHPMDVERETRGITVDGLLCYPQALPSKILRVFRTKFKSLQEVEDELRRVKIIQRYLAPHNIAPSEEFIVSYVHGGKQDIILCGLQEYVMGRILEPWSPLDEDCLVSLYSDGGFGGCGESGTRADEWVRGFRHKAASFVGKLKEMIMEADHIPDLAGVGNLLVTPTGDIRLVDINNISFVHFDQTIHLDDKGYPVCDKSMEALFHLETKLVHRTKAIDDAMYGVFLDPRRMQEVQSIDEAFHHSLRPQLSSVQWS